MKLVIEIGQDDDVAEQTTTFHVKFNRQELINMGPPPREFCMTAGHDAFLYDPAVNPSGCDTVPYKLLQLAWMAQKAITPKGTGFPLETPRGARHFSKG